MTVLEAIQKSADFLGKKGVESPRLHAELLLAHQLQLPRMKLYLNFDRGLTPAETDGLRELIKRRAAREPLQHITGSTSFCGHEIAVNRHALVPRPETELLAELGGKFLAERIEFLTGDGFAALKNAGAPERPFDLIISNPPYIASAEIATLEPEVRDFDPRAALDGGADGLDFYRRLAAEAKPWLKPDGKIMLEFGDGQAGAIQQIFAAEKWIVEAVQEDYSHRARILVAKM